LFINLTDIDGLVQEAKLKYIQSVISAKFGNLASRVFRLLYDRKHLQEKQVSQFGLLSEKKTREILVKLHKENFIRMEVCCF
jgi:DNA-directed RNA polymerase III subunit RPC3